MGSEMCIRDRLNSFTKIDEDFFDELEESLIMADVGAVTSARICENLRKKVKEEGLSDPAAVKGALKEIIAQMLAGDEALNLSTKPSIILVIGVNGVGKTTTIGKLAHNLHEDGKKVLLAAAEIPSARRPSTNCRSGPTAPGWIWSSTARAPIRQRWCLMRSTPARQELSLIHISEPTRP